MKKIATLVFLVGTTNVLNTMDVDSVARAKKDSPIPQGYCGWVVPPLEMDLAIYLKVREEYNKLSYDLKKRINVSHSQELGRCP